MKLLLGTLSGGQTSWAITPRRSLLRYGPTAKEKRHVLKRPIHCLDKGVHYSFASPLPFSYMSSYFFYVSDLDERCQPEIQLR